MVVVEVAVHEGIITTGSVVSGFHRHESHLLRSILRSSKG